MGKEGIYLTEVSKTPKKKSSQAFELLNSYIKEKQKEPDIIKGIELLDFAFLDILNLDT